MTTTSGTASKSTTNISPRWDLLEATHAPKIARLLVALSSTQESVRGCVFIIRWTRSTCPLSNMDTTVEAVSTDKLGRRSGPRRKHTIAEKPAMVEETHRRGASVAEVAQRHQVNANLLFGSRRLYQRGVLNEESSSIRLPR